MSACVSRVLDVGDGGFRVFLDRLASTLKGLLSASSLDVESILESDSVQHGSGFTNTHCGWRSSETDRLSELLDGRRQPSGNMLSLPTNDRLPDGIIVEEQLKHCLGFSDLTKELKMETFQVFFLRHVEEVYSAA